MQVSISEWCEFRKPYILRLIKDLKDHKVDADIVDLLIELNSITCIVSTSSCSGRIALFAAPSPGDKQRGGKIFSWHRCVSVEELGSHIEKVLQEYSSEPYVWLSAQPLILTMYVPCENLAENIVSIAQSVGLKYSGYRRVKQKLYYIFILGTERIDIPLSYGGQRVFGKDTYNLLSSIVNSYLMLAKKKLEKFKRAVYASLNILNALCRQCIKEAVCGDEATLFRAYKEAMKNTDLSERKLC
jgi:tRNA wybutosine-synthesizing protein 3